MLPSFSSQQPLCSRGNKNIFRPTRFIIHRTKISEFLLVRTNSKIFPQSRTPSCVHANGSLDEQARVELDTVIKHLSAHSSQKESPPFDKLARLSLHRRLFVNFLPLVIPVTPRSIIDHDRPDQRLRPMEIPCRAISSPREERGPPPSLSLSTSRGGGRRFVCVRLGDHPFSLPLHPHPVWQHNHRV